MRFAVLGAGAIGGVIGGGLHRAGHDVTLIARGAAADALRADGLTLQTPDGDEVLRVPVGTVDDVRDGDVVILAVKSQDTVAALDSLAGATSPSSARRTASPTRSRRCAASSASTASSSGCRASTSSRA